MINAREKNQNELKLRIEDLFQLRQKFAEEPTKRGLDNSSTLIRDRPKTIKDNLFSKVPQKTCSQVKLKDIQQEALFLEKQYNQIELALKITDDNEKEGLLKKRNALGERVNQLKRMISERTTPQAIQKNQAFDAIRKLERYLKDRDSAFKDIIKRADQLSTKDTKNYKSKTEKTDKTHSHLKESLKNLEKSFSKTEKANLAFKIDPNVYTDEVKFIGQQINQLKINIRKATKESSKARLEGFNKIRKLERDLEKRDSRFKEVIKMLGHLKNDKKEPEKLKDTVKKFEAKSK
ncbi:MAG: hypothetical protein GY707_08080 [Desulfobacteraceae bacterium]|nr:hypothetical protein [Desulfobacteraceae bacterium]